MGAMHLALLITAFAAAQPQPASVLAASPVDPQAVALELQRFSGAVMTVRHNSPVPALIRYRDRLCCNPAADYREAAYARFAWDVWDDVRLAIEAHDAGDWRELRERLGYLRRKLGDDAYNLGLMPAIPEEAYTVTERGGPP